MSSFSAIALPLAALGYRVHPLKPGAKVPATKWTEWANSDEATIQRWSTSNKGAHGCGIAGGNGLIILDADSDAAKSAFRAAMGAELEGWLAATEAGDVSPLVITQGGGWHVYLRAPEGSRAHGCHNAINCGGVVGFDVRGEGGYVVAPGTTVLATQDATSGKWKAAASLSAPAGAVERTYRGELPKLVDLPVLTDVWFTALSMGKGGGNGCVGAKGAAGASSASPGARVAVLGQNPPPATLDRIRAACEALGPGLTSNATWEPTMLAIAGGHRRGEIAADAGGALSEADVRQLMLEVSALAGPAWPDAAGIARIDQMLKTATGKRGIGSLFHDAVTAGWVDPRSAAAQWQALVAGGPSATGGATLTLKEHVMIATDAIDSTSFLARAMLHTAALRERVMLDTTTGRLMAYQPSKGAWGVLDVLTKGAILTGEMRQLRDQIIDETRDVLAESWRQQSAALGVRVEAEKRAKTDRVAVSESHIIAKVIEQYQAAALEADGAANELTAARLLQRANPASLPAAQRRHALDRQYETALRLFGEAWHRERGWAELAAIIPAQMQHAFDGRPAQGFPRAVMAGSDCTLLADGSLVAHDAGHRCTGGGEWSFAAAPKTMPNVIVMLGNLLGHIGEPGKAGKPARQDAARYIMGWVGKVMRGERVGQALFLLGANGSGKSTLIELIEAVFAGATGVVNATLLCGEEDDYTTHAGLCSKRLLICHEFQYNKKGAPDYTRAKTMITHEPYTPGKGRVTYARQPGAALVFSGGMLLASNEPPKATGEDLRAMMRRSAVLALPPTATLKPEAQDPGFKARVKAEVVPFARACLVTAEAWEARLKPQGLVAGVAAFGASADTAVTAWMDEGVEEGAIIRAPDLFWSQTEAHAAFGRWWAQQGYGHAAPSIFRFAELMGQAGIARETAIIRLGTDGRRDSAGRQVRRPFRGLTLASPAAAWRNGAAGAVHGGAIVVTVGQGP